MSVAGVVETRADVIIIGAGPAGSLAAALLCQQGHRVLVLERDSFPRFSIGESLLPQSMEFLEKAGMLRAVVEAGFQFKDGAAFVRGERSSDFDFRDKYSQGWGTAYQVPRARFDHLLALEAERFGAEVRYRQEVVAADVSGAMPRVSVRDADGHQYLAQARFMLDASGFGRTLARLLNLEIPSAFPLRAAMFTHIEDRIQPSCFDRNKIRITVHPELSDVWYWLIPFSDGRSSIGVVADAALIERPHGSVTEQLQAWVSQDPALRSLLESAVWDTPARRLVGYSCNVKSLTGPGFVLLGNAAEFLDPIFSSGVTIAFKSASLAADLLRRHLSGTPVHWTSDYVAPLRRGIDTFRAFVESWYRGGFQRIVFHQNQPAEIRRMLSAILAGYAWDERNPYVREPQRRLAALEELC